MLFVKLFLFQTLRYFIIGGGALIILNVWAKERFKKYRIQESQIKKQQLLSEIKYSISTLLIFSVFYSTILDPRFSTYIRLYSDFKDYPIWWNLLTVPFLLIFHDTYFYWMHRTLHHRFFYRKFHSVHHLSTNPTPLASFSFHPVEAILETIWILPLLIFFPIQKYILLSFAFISFLNNIKGHLGFDFSRHKYGILNSSFHHSMHHRHFNSNYGLYFLFWDKICKTEKV